jgi:hypothetical protein
MSDLVLSLVLSISCLAVILLFYFIWRKQYQEIKKIYPLFRWVYTALVIIFISIAIMSVVKSDDYAFDYLRKVLCIETVATVIWYAAWTSQYKMDKEDGIAPKN